jgi:CheY-like chemotaxis protein
MLPVVMVTALDNREERVRGLEAGADDFLSKPVNPPELIARVRSLLRIRRLYETVQKQAEQLKSWNRMLEGRVAEEVARSERLQRLKRFFSPQLAELILAGGADDPLESHRRDVTVVFLDLRGFTGLRRIGRARGGDGGAFRVPPRDGPAHPRIPGHARALHRATE